MGSVYLTERAGGEIQQRVAIKFLHPGGSRGQPRLGRLAPAFAGVVRADSKPALLQVRKNPAEVMAVGGGVGVPPRVQVPQDFVFPPALIR